MATRIGKLRQDYKKEQFLMRKLISDAGDDMFRTSVRKEPVAPIHTVKYKLEVDPVKLEASIKKACVHVEKKSIVVLKDQPVKSTTTAKHHVVVVAICQSKNLNGTPCKCKAKVGKFCTKHAT